MTPVFDDETRAAFIVRHGVDPEESYRLLLLEIRVGGPVYQRLVRMLGLVEGRPLSLTSRQREVMVDYVRGLVEGDTASRLFLSVETIRDHRKNVRKYLGARSTAQAAVLCLVLGLLDEPAVGAVAA